MMMTPDSIIMGKVADVAMSSDSGIADFFKAIIPKIPAILLMVVVKKSIDNAGDFFGVSWGYLMKTIKYIARIGFYKEVKLNQCNSSSNLDFYLKKTFEARKAIFDGSFTFPVYTQTISENEYSISYVENYSGHKNEITICEEEAKRQKDEYLLVKTQSKIVYKKLGINDSKQLVYNACDFSILYPSRNYKNLVEIIRAHCNVSRIVKSYSVLGLLIDGVPGLGKTKFSDYAAELKIVGYIYKVDMTTMLEHPYKEVLKVLYHKIAITCDTMFVIDEIDKYIEYRIQFEYSELLKTPTKPTDAEAAIPEFAQFEKQSKITFLYEMLSILERDGLNDSVIVIFCSNNFHSIFEGIDVTHFVSLYDRFVKVNFHKCNHDEIVKYIMYYNEKLKGTDLYCNIHESSLRDSLRLDIEITHRTLHHISVHTKYNAMKMVDMINKHENEDDSGESIVDRIKEFKSKKDKRNPQIINTPIKTNKEPESPNVLTPIDIEEKVKRYIANPNRYYKSESGKFYNEENDNILIEKVFDPYTGELIGGIEYTDDGEFIDTNGDIISEDKKKIYNEQLRIQNELEETKYKELYGEKLTKIQEYIVNPNSYDHIKGKYINTNSDNELIEIITHPETSQVLGGIERTPEGKIVNSSGNILPEHKRIWYEEYCVKYQKPFSTSNDFICVNVEFDIKAVKGYVEKNENAIGRENKIAAVTEMFDYLSDKGCGVIVANSKFKKTVIDKIEEFHLEAPEMFSSFKPETKKFIYAISGIEC
jgi:uncharacterized protein YutD